MKLGITGSRTNTAFDFTPVFTRQVGPFNAFLGRKRVSSIITGGARGIDRQAQKCAEGLNIQCRVLRSAFDKYHRSAPLKRNLQIIEESDAILVVWDGEPNSRGTIYTALHALEAGKRVFVIFAVGETIIECFGEIHDDSCFIVNRSCDIPIEIEI